MNRRHWEIDDECSDVINYDVGHVFVEVHGLTSESDAELARQLCDALNASDVAPWREAKPR